MENSNYASGKYGKCPNCAAKLSYSLTWTTNASVPTGEQFGSVSLSVACVHCAYRFAVPLRELDFISSYGLQDDLGALSELLYRLSVKVITAVKRRILGEPC